MTTSSKTNGAAPAAPDLPKKSHHARLKLAKPALAAALAAIDAESEFATPGRETEEARILAKLVAYRAWLVAHDLRPPRNGTKPDAVAVLRAIGHYEWKAAGVVRLTIYALGDLLREGDAFRHRPERYIDFALDAFAERVAQRGYGLPRRRDDGKICWASTAEDAGVPLHTVDAIAINRLRAIDLTVKGAGIVVDPEEPPLFIDGRPPPNPAARTLIDIAGAEIASPVIADPLDPAAPLVAEFADLCGVGATDIVFSPSNRAAMDAIVARTGLAPHPVIALRAFTFRDMKDYGRPLRRAECAGRADPAGAARDTVGSLTKFMTAAGFSDGDAVPNDFHTLVGGAVAGHNGSHGSGWKSDMERWVRWADALRAAKPLPGLFGPALRVLMAEAGMTIKDLRRDHGTTGVRWADGTAVPSHQSEASFQQLAERLRTPAERMFDLISKEWRRHLVARPDDRVKRVARSLPENYRELTDAERQELLDTRFAEPGRQPTEWARKVAQAFKDEYRLPEEAWTPAMREAFKSIVPDPKATRPRIRRPGERNVADHRPAKPRKPWRQPSTDWAAGLMSYMLGFYARPSGDGGPREVDDIAPEEDAVPDGVFRAEPGLGIPSELLHPAVLVLIDLFILYAHWNRSRNGGELSPIMIDTVRFVMDMLRPETGHIWKNPQFLGPLEAFVEWWDENPPVTLNGGPLFDIAPFREDWQAAVAAEYQQLTRDLKDFKANKLRKLRDPFEPVSVFLDDKTEAGPLGAYMVGVRNLLAAKPTNTMSRHVHNRTCILTLILVQTALRAKNLLLTVGGQNPTLRRETGEDGTVLWRILIPGEEFKNYHSAHFGNGRNFDFVLEDEDGLYERMDRYVTKGRRYMLAGRETDAFFVTANGTDLTVATMREIYHGITEEHFVWNEATGRGIKGAMMHGVHAVRHVIATHLVRTEGDLYQAAWALQDSLRTVDRHYARFLPGDRLRLAARALKRARMGLTQARTDDEVAATVARSMNAANTGNTRQHYAT